MSDETGNTGGGMEGLASRLFPSMNGGDKAAPVKAPAASVHPGSDPKHLGFLSRLYPNMNSPENSAVEGAEPAQEQPPAQEQGQGEPEGTPFDPASMGDILSDRGMAEVATTGQFSEFAQRHNLSTEAVNEILDMQQSAMVETFDAAEAEWAAETQAQFSEDDIGAAVEVYREVVPEDVRLLLNNLGLSSHPSLVGLFVNLARERS